MSQATSDTNDEFIRGARRVMTFVGGLTAYAFTSVDVCACPLLGAFVQNSGTKGCGCVVDVLARPVCPAH